MRWLLSIEMRPQTFVILMLFAFTSGILHTWLSSSEEAWRRVATGLQRTFSEVRYSVYYTNREVQLYATLFLLFLLSYSHWQWRRKRRAESERVEDSEDEHHRPFHLHQTLSEGSLYGSPDIYDPTYQSGVYYEENCSAQVGGCRF